MKIISPQSGDAFYLKSGQNLTVVDLEGSQVSDLFCFNASDVRECFSASRSIDYADCLLLGLDDFLYSNRSQRMLKIIVDDVKRHDVLMPPCSLRMFQIVSGQNTYHPSCHENLALKLKQFGISADSIGTTFNIFMNVEFKLSGQLEIVAPLSRAGSTIKFRAEMDLFVGLTACSHEETNNGQCKSIGYWTE